MVALFLGYLPCSLILSSLSCSLVSALGFGLSRTLGLGDPVPFTVVLAVPHVGACCMQSLLGSDPVSPCSASLVLTFLGPVLLLVAAFIFWLFWDQSSLSPFAWFSCFLFWLPFNRINLSPFSKDFRGGERLHESFVNSYKPTHVCHILCIWLCMDLLR